MKRWHIFLIAIAVAVFLYNFRFKPLCYDITELESGAIKQQILLDKCTGDTWTMAREEIKDDKGKATGEYTFQWTPVQLNYAGRAVWSKK
jgi:hypothetical protein